jgi:hypothetical protein
MNFRVHVKLKMRGHDYGAAGALLISKEHKFIGYRHPVAAEELKSQRYCSVRCPSGSPVDAPLRMR